MQAPEGIAVGGTRPDGVLDDDEAEIGLPHLVAQAGDDHGQLGAFDLVEPTWVGRLRGLERLVDVPQGAFAVDLNSPVQIDAGQSPGGSDLTQRLVVVSCEVRGDTGGLPHDGDATRVGCGVARVLVGRLRVVLQQPLSHHKMTGDVLGVGSPQGTQLIPGAPLEVCGFDLVRHRRLRNALTLWRATAMIIAPVSAVPPPGTVVVSTCLPATSVRVLLTEAPISTSFTPPVVPLLTVLARGALVMIRTPRTHRSVRGLSVSVVGPAPRRVVAFKTLAAPEAVTVTVSTTPT